MYAAGMRKALSTVLAVSLLASLAGACGSDPPPPPNPPPAPAPTPTPTVATPEPTATVEPAKPEPTPEEKKKAEAAAKLAADKDKWASDHKAELARWTPEMHTAAKALAEKVYPSLKAGITAAMAGKHRMPGNAERDKFRHPLETLEHFGIKPNMTVLDVGPGTGWYTELLAPTLAMKGKYIGTSGDPNGPAEERSTFYANEWKDFLATAPEIYGKVETVVVDGKAPALNMDGKLDAVLVMRGLHGMVNRGNLEAWLGEWHKALKTGGVVGIEEHRAKDDADPKESSKKGYVPQKFVIESFEKAGFKLVGKPSEVNANPKDTKDYPEGVWTLPPSLELKDKDKDKYTAIGESDRMTLKFVKVAIKAEKPKAEAKPAAASEKPAMTAMPKPAGTAAATPPPAPIK